MPFNGQGVFQRVYQWVNDASNNLFVDATRTDTDSNDIADGLTNCITRDGQSPALANLPMNNFKFTGLGSGQNPNDSVNYGQVFNAPAFVAPTSTTSPTLSDNGLRLVTVNLLSQTAFQTALPQQSLGFLRSTGTVAGFTTSHTGYAQNETKGANVASSATVDLTSPTGNLVHITGTTGISAITVPSGAERVIVFDGVLTLTHSAGTLKLPTNMNITTTAGDIAVLRGDGTTTTVMGYMRANGQIVGAVADNEIVVNTGNGFGTTNTFIRRFTTVLNNVGTAISYADNSALGASFTINEAGLYEVYAADQNSTSVVIGISLNTVAGATSIHLVAPPSRIAMSGILGASGGYPSTNRLIKLASGDVIRPHWGDLGNGTPISSSTYAYFSIRKVVNL